MDSLFNLLTSTDQTIIALLTIAITLIVSFIYTLIISFKFRGTKSFFITSILMPVVVASVISMVSLYLDSSTSGTVRIVTIAVALGLIRFRSINASAEELLILFGGVAIGLIAGLGYVAIASIIALVISVLYVALSNLNLFKTQRFNEEKLLKVTIPEDLNYEEEFKDILDKHLKSHKLISIKTSAMGSLFKLSYKVELNDKNREKDLINDLRIKNSNLEISLVPYVEENKTL